MTVSVLKMHFRKLLTKVITYSDFKKFENERFMDSLYLALNSQNIDYTKILDLFFSIYQNRSSHRRCSVRKGILRNFEKLTGQSIFFNKVVGLLACIFIKNEALVQELSCEFCKISKNTSGRLLLPEWSKSSCSKKKRASVGVINLSWLKCSLNLSWKESVLETDFRKIRLMKRD